MGKPAEKRRHGLTLTEVVYVTSLMLILWSAPHPSWFEAPQRARISRAQNEMRSIAIALEAYESERGAYLARLDEIRQSTPVLDPFKTHTFVPWTAIDRSLFLFKPGAPRLPWPAWSGLALLFLFVSVDTMHRFVQKTPKRWWMTGLHVAAFVIATGIASWLLIWPSGPGYYRERKIDSGSPADLEYGYWTDGKTGYVLQTVGVNEKRDLDDLRRVPIADHKTAQQFLVHYSYDPTNGTATPGDIFRVGIAGKN